VLKEMLKECPRDSTRSYNLLLNACAKARKWEHAQRVFEVSLTDGRSDPRAPFRLHETKASVLVKTRLRVCSDEAPSFDKVVSAVGEPAPMIWGWSLDAQK